MTRKYFGTDGIRGTVGIHPITPDFALRLAHAVGRVLKQKEACPLVLIGKVISASHNPFADNGIKFFSAAVPSRCCAWWSRRAMLTRLGRWPSAWRTLQGIDMDQMCSDAWRWQSANPNGHC